MKFVLVHFTSAKFDWGEEGVQEYRERIGHFVGFEVVKLKSKSADRDHFDVRKRSEEEALFHYLKPTDRLVLFDETGLSLDSLGFSRKIQGLYESGASRVVFVIGGAYGVTDEVKKRANLKLSLAPFVMNHVVAQLVALEQIYRSFTIIKGIPYHNA